MMKTIVTSLCALLFAQVAWGESPVDISVELEPLTARIADPITLTITAETPQGVSITFPQSTPTLGPFDVIDIRDDMDIPFADGRKFVRRYSLECIRPGKQKIPPLDIAYVDRRDNVGDSGIVSTKPQSITIATSLDAPVPPTEFRDIKPVVFLEETTLQRSSVPLWVWITTGSILLAVLGIVYFITRPSKPIPPAQWALTAIDDLRDRSSKTSDGNWIQQRLSDVIREFVNRQFGIAAPRLTTDEFLLELENHARLPESLRQPMRRFMQSADMIKFAAASADSDSVEQSIDHARKFVIESETIATEEKADDAMIPSRPEADSEIANSEIADSKTTEVG